MFLRALHAIEMPLAAVDELSDASPAADATSAKPEKPIKNAKPKQQKKLGFAAKPQSSPASPVKTKVQKKPAASISGTLKRPASAVLGDGDGMPRKVTKYWYKKDQKIGIKVNGSEKMTVCAQALKDYRTCASNCPDS